MVEIIPFREEHIEQIKPRNEQLDEPIPNACVDAVTVLFDKVPGAIIGWHIVCPGVVQVWAIVSEKAKEQPIAFHKSVLSLLEASIEKYGIQRIQMSVRVGFAQGWRWALSLGFQCEGTMQKYGPDGSNYWLFARVV